ncbi:hypothetical protein FQZ97_659410 [compost metagenome]
MGADHQLRLARLHACRGLALVARLQAAGQPGHRHAERLQPGRQFAEVLLGQDFGRRHQRRLVAGIDGLARRQRGDDGLAAADVALQQPVHRVRARHVGGDLRHHPLLRAGQPERQRRQEARQQAAFAARHGRRGLLAPRRVRAPQRNLLRQQFVELDALPGRVRAVGQRRFALFRRRRMQQAQAIGQRAQLQACQRPLQHQARQRLRHRRARQRAADGLAQVGLRDAGGGRIHRCQPVGQRFALDHGTHRRVDHLGAEEAAADLATHAQAYAFCHLLGLAAVEVQEAQRQLAGLIDDLDHQLAARAERDFVGDDLAFHLRRLAEPRAADRVGDRRQRGLVLVAHGQVQHQVDRAAQAELGEAGCRR